MSLSISGTLPVPLADTPVPAQAPTKQAEQPQPQPAVDTVLLSQSAQINQLYLQGQSPQQIAENLGLAQLTVNSDLGIVATTVTSNTADAPAATAQPATAPAATITRSTSPA